MNGNVTPARTRCRQLAKVGQVGKGEDGLEVFRLNFLMHHPLNRTRRGCKVWLISNASR